VALTPAAARTAAALLIVAVSLAGVLLRPRGLSEAVFSAAGAAAMVVLGLVPAGQAARLLLQSWNVLLFFTGLVLIAWAAERSGFFRWAALWAARLAGGSARRLLVNVFVTGVAISTFLSNDATALLLTPMIISVAEETGLTPLPFALAGTFIADTASVTLPVSNPINVLYLDSFRGIRLASYLQHLLVPSAAAIAINLLLFLWIFRRPLRQRFPASSLAEPAAAIPHWPYFRFTLACLALLVAGYLVFAVLGLPLSLVAVAGALALALGGVATGQVLPRAIGRAPWAILPFIAGLLVLVQGLENTGVTGLLGAGLVGIAERGRLAGVLSMVFGAGIGANLVNNVPAASILTSAIRQARAQPLPLRRDLVYAGIFGCDVGPNLTILGSLSTMLWLVMLRSRGLRVTSWQYIRIGLLVTPLMLLAGALLIALL
jgi:arsenical pump membrane protein